MALLYYDPVFLEHDTGEHPESAARIIPAARRLQSIALEMHCGRPCWAPISAERLLRVHSQKYVDSIRTFAEAGGGHIEADTVVSRRSYEVALSAAGAACDAVERVINGEDQHAFCLVRPPGHHALFSHAMGFCLFNNVALAARVAIHEFELDRVLIVDWDVHHGNGTQDIFWEDGQVGYLSIHRSPFYPGTGDADEIGAGAGLGTTLNLPVAFGTPRSDYLQMFASALEQFAQLIKPQLILISAGFDSHRDDPFGSLGLESEDFGKLTRCILDIAATYADGRVISILEGGYNPTVLAECVEVHLHELLTG